MGSSRAAWVLLGVFAIVWFSALGYRSLAKPDEGRYAEIAREMSGSGDWVTPRLNGIKYFEKPALQYWATAGAFRAFGEREWAARLWTGLTGFCGVLLAVFAGRRLYGRTAGLLAGAVLGSSLMYFVMGHVNTLDMGLTAFIELALVAFLLAQQAPPRSRPELRWMLVVWAALALATLSKGLVAVVLPFATLAAYSALQRDLAPWRRLRFAAGVPLFLAIAAPWFVAVSLANPEFPRFFFVHEHFERFLTTEHHRVQAVWYFVPILAAGLLPWTTVAAQGLVEAWRGPAPSPSNPAWPGPLHAGRFLVLWTAVVFGFFSASGSKLPSYILPVFPAVAILAGDALARMPGRTLRAHLIPVFVLALAALPFLYWGRFDDDPETVAMTARYVRWLLVAFAILAAGSAFAWRRARERPVGGALALGAAALVLSATALLGHEALGRWNSAHYIAGEIRRELKPDAPFYSVGLYDQTLPFYLRRTVTLVAYADEFEFGLAQEPQLRIDTIEAFEKRWREDPMAYAVMSEETRRQLEADGLRMRVLAYGYWRVIVAKP
jgi:4-amino-4-deoxy-L-arabinose transferase-like glycosyltransferase